MRRILAVLALVALPIGAGADTGTDLVFAPNQLAGLAAGERLVYAHARGGEAALRPVEGGTWELAIEEGDGARAAILSIRAGTRARELEPFPGDETAGNPVLIAFLETVTRRVAEATGGSPFYIRNRIRDALRAGGTVRPADGAREIAYSPFRDDPNARALGAFRELEIAFSVAETAPGRFRRLSAATPGAEPAYRETLDLIAPKEDR